MTKEKTNLQTSQMFHEQIMLMPMINTKLGHVFICPCLIVCIIELPSYSQKELKLKQFQCDLGTILQRFQMQLCGDLRENIITNIVPKSHRYHHWSTLVTKVAVEST